MTVRHKEGAMLTNGQTEFQKMFSRIDLEQLEQYLIWHQTPPDVMLNYLTPTGRKARPDTKRICNWVNRKYGRSVQEVVQEIDDLCQQAILENVRHMLHAVLYQKASFIRVIWLAFQVFQRELLEKYLLNICRKGLIPILTFDLFS